MFLDIATWDEYPDNKTGEDSYYKPTRSNHVSRNKVYQNVGFYDGHVDGQRLVSNKSWHFGADYYQRFFLTEPSVPGSRIELAP